MSGAVCHRCVVGLLQLAAMLVGCFIVHDLDSTTRENCRLLAMHSQKIHGHSQQIDTLSKLISVELKPETAREINAMYDQMDEVKHVAIR